MSASVGTAAATNPLLEDWAGPWGGVPPFDRVAVADFEPALEAAMAEQLAEIEAIVASPEPATFENTVAALERSGSRLERVSAVYGVWAGGVSTAEFQAVQRVMAPRLAAFSDRITQNVGLFRRLEAVYRSVGEAGLSPEQERLAWWYHNHFVRAGARLGEGSKARLSEINQRLAALFTAFNQNVLADESERYLVLESEAELAGLPASERAAAAAAAAALGLEGRWVIANTRSAMEPFLTYSDRRELRERGWRLWSSRGEGEGDRDNHALVAEILGLRAERARLLGYETHAHWRLENTMAATPERVLELLEAVWPPAVARVREEVAAMASLARAEGADGPIAPWDYRYYAEKVRRERYDLDQNEVKPYLRLDRLVEGMFWVAGELFGFVFTPVDGVPVHDRAVRVWEVCSRDDGRHIGLFYFDPFARPAKRSGAWMASYRRQCRDGGVVTAIVSNNSNFSRTRPGEAVLISWDDAETLFHEFGHAVHALASDVRYPSLSGTAVARDYVEFPSQLMEHWLSTPEVLERFALHHETDDPIPVELVERIERAQTFNQGFATVEYLAAALLDMKVHLEADHPIDPAAFERDTLAALGMPPEVGMRHRTPHFSHAFGSDSYSAGYYSYLWADVLTADAFEAFTEAGGPWDRDVARSLLEHVLSAGNTVDPAAGYRAFRGRDARVAALMRKRGFVA